MSAVTWVTRAMRTALAVDSRIGLMVLAIAMVGVQPPRALAAWAEGGTVTNYTDAGGTNWTAHIFTNTASSTSLTFSVGGEVEYLIVAGGGGGGSNTSSWAAGGGGAGGLLSGVTNVSATGYNVVVGDGGTDANGQSSSFGALTAYGGGNGGNGKVNGSPGGSGGGGGSDYKTGGAGTNDQGSAGGNGGEYNGGGGGGAGFIGGNAGATGGVGGRGITCATRREVRPN